MFHKIKQTWAMLDRSIYVGERLKANLTALTVVSCFTALLGLVLIALNLATGQADMLIPAIATFLGGIACAFIAGVLKNREKAILVPILFCAVAFTVYTLNGNGNGAAMFWTMMLPIGISYFVSVKYGILLSIYYTIFFAAVFYTPFFGQVVASYPQGFTSRFPLMYASMAIFTAIAMVQYHRGVLLENEYAEELNREVARQTQVARERADRLEALSEEMVETLAVTIDAKDRYTNGHSFRVSWYSVALAQKLGWTEAEVKNLEREALLHDIGKIGVPDAVLNKPGRLTDEEFVIIQSHTTVGGSILSRSDNLLSAAQVALFHHERYDGRGYPEGRSGAEIPVHARVVAIADAYDAMHSDRIYRKGLPHDIIRQELIRGRGTQFDPDFLDAFLALFDSGELDRTVQRREAAGHGVDVGTIVAPGVEQ
jgi:HD-GYP domain-containing protein (c-di-GMP phosphodiesterase class II)